MEDAKPSVATTEDRSEPTSDSSKVVNETADPKTSSKDETSVEVPFNINNYPEEQRETVQKIRDQINLDFKRPYTKKFQELASKERVWTEKIQTLQGQVDQFTQIAKEILMNPEKINEYRAQLGIKGSAKKEPDPQQFETVGDLIKHYEDRLTHEKNNLLNQVDQTIAKKIQETQRYGRWETAVNSMGNDTTFKKYQDYIMKSVESNLKYREIYDGTNEYDILRYATEDFKTMMRSDLEKAKQDTIEALKKKSTASLLVPRKSVGASSNQSKKTKEEMIAAVQQRFS